MNWKHTIDIKEAWKKSLNKQITVATLAGVIAKKLRALPSDLPDVSMQIAEFEGLAQEEELDEDEFDDAFESLYDWADKNRVWIATLG